MDEQFQERVVLEYFAKGGVFIQISRIVVIFALYIIRHPFFLTVFNSYRDCKFLNQNLLKTAFKNTRNINSKSIDSQGYMTQKGGLSCICSIEISQMFIDI